MKTTRLVLLVLLHLAVPAAVEAQFGYVTNTDNTITITHYAGPGGVVTIPATITGLPVASIGDDAFSGAGLVGVIIPASVTHIGDYAFFGSDLVSITIPATVTSIGSNVFYLCSHLTKITIDNGVTSIGTNEFEECGLTSITIPNSVISIGDGAFNFCSDLTSVTIGNSVTTIGSNAFAYCFSLTSATIPDSVINIGGGAFQSCESLTNITIGNNVAIIGDSAFNACIVLTNAVIPDSVTSIGFGAFEYCDHLASATLGNGVTSIGDYAFSGDGLNSITIPNNVASIGAFAFFMEGSRMIPSVAIPGSVTNVGVGAFSGFDLHAINVAAENSFYSSKNGVLFDKNQTTLLEYPNGLFVSYMIPDSVTSVAAYAFQYGDLTNVTIPNSVTSIGESAFEDCASLTNVTIGKSLTSIGSNAFTYCDGLTSIYFEGNAPAADATAFESDTNATAYYLSGTIGWGATFAGIPTALWSAQTGSLQITIEPAGAITAGARWQVDDGVTNGSGAMVANILVGAHTVSFAQVLGWNAPSNQTVTIKNGTTTKANGVYKMLPPNSATLVVVVPANENGKVNPNDNGKLLGLGTNFTLTAVPGHNWIFSNWVASGSANFVSNNPVLKLKMQSNLVLQANFVTNVFLAAKGAYNGLFAPSNAPRQQTDSGAITFTVSSAGVLSGKLTLGLSTPSLKGQFKPDGFVSITTPRKDESSLITTLQLDFADQSVSGTVSDGNFTAQLNGDRDVFSSSDPATEFEGQYTFIIPGTTNSNVGPYGTSYGTVTVSSLGTITFAGSLADGTAISQSSVVSPDGLWPFYVRLYGDKGSLWGWNNFTNHTITSAYPLSWINATNSSRTAVYRSGFTNQEATLTGGLYVSTTLLPSDLTATFGGGNLPLWITNGVTISASDKITMTNKLDETNKLTLTITKTTGVISGSFANPDEPKQTIKVNGVILQGQTNAQGYFLGTNQSGAFLLDSP